MKKTIALAVVAIFTAVILFGLTTTTVKASEITGYTGNWTTVAKMTNQASWSQWYDPMKRWSAQLNLWSFSGSGSASFTNGGNTMNVDLTWGGSMGYSLEGRYNLGNARDELRLSYFSTSSSLTAAPRGTSTTGNSSTTITGGSMTTDLSCRIIEMAYRHAFTLKDTYRLGVFAGIDLMDLEVKNFVVSGLTGTINNNGSVSKITGLSVTGYNGRGYVSGPLPTAYLWGELYLDQKKKWLAELRLLPLPIPQVNLFNYHLGLSYNHKNWTYGLQLRQFIVKSTFDNGSANMTITGIGANVMYKF